MNNFRKVQTIPIRSIQPLICSNSVRKRLLCTATKSINEQNERTASFGFQTVPENEKADKVYKVFEDVASSYDLMNDAMSMGIHRLWKDIFMQRLGPVHGTKLLDMAGGTGDIAFRYIKYLNNLPKSNDSSADNQKTSHVTIADINQNMLDVGKQRAKALNFTNETLKTCTIDWACVNAEELPFESNSFNAYTIAFGIRNVTRIDKVIAEAYRVLQPGGRFLCLEFSHLNNETLQWIYDQYSFTCIPPMGHIFTGQWEAYQYLVESIRRFPQQDKFKQMIQEAGFNCVNYENLTFGMVAIHSGFKL